MRRSIFTARYDTTRNSGLITLFHAATKTHPKDVSLSGFIWIALQVREPHADFGLLYPIYLTPVLHSSTGDRPHII